MKLLTIPSKMPEYREKRAHSDFLCHIQPHFSDTEHFFSQFQNALHTVFSIVSANIDEASSALNKPHRQATTFVTV
jgi:hypothetical protein